MGEVPRDARSDVVRELLGRLDLPLDVAAELAWVDAPSKERAMRSKLSLRDFQEDLNRRVAVAGQAHAQINSSLGLEAGGMRWLMPMSDAEAILPVPAFTDIPFARPWFRGLARVREELLAIIDFAAICGAEPLRLNSEARLVVLSARFRTGSALLFERSLGLCDTGGSIQQSIDLDLPWCTSRCRQADDSCWNQLDVAALIGDPRFMEITQ